MKPVCEVMVTQILPAIRALVARKLVEKHGFSQKAAAEKLGTSQPAISQYSREIRGYKNHIIKSDPKIMEMIDIIAERVSRGELSQEMLTMEFCNICRYMRSSGMLCEIHRKLYPSLEKCTICIE